MKRTLLIASLIGAFVLAAVLIQLNRHVEPNPTALLKAKYAQKHVASVDHSKLPALQKKFASPQEVTRACNSCHTERHKEVMRSNHWNWSREEYIPGRGIRTVGKKNVLNNFCIGTQSNEQSCAKCHIGFGMTEKGFRFDNPDYVDCMACHDNSGTYRKAAEQGGAPEKSVNLTEVAQHVGRPTRVTCGTCHFFGGGGNNVKHGDLEMAMFDPSKDVDVHMASEGADLQCTACHTAENHVIRGKIYSLSSMNRNRSSCEQCHTGRPHADDVINQHTVKVACQACHIPVYAKVNATKMEWDWSTAGRLKNGEPYETDDADGNHTYLSIKGSFSWAKNIEPEYVWFNGTANHYLLGDKTDTNDVIRINSLNGSYADRDAKIIPVKIHRARQIYDPVTKLLIQPNLFAPEKGEGAFWKDFDWNRAAEAGMKRVNLPYSGHYTFVRTEMYWPVNHMVSTKEKSVECSECHRREHGRLAALTDFYMPGRNTNAGIELFGKGLLMLSLIGVAGHAGLRALAARQRRRGSERTGA
ncbi:MAG: tetrathionate reductase family octaheme c-type cytochrome [Acidobacteriota bacterium]